MSQDKSKEHKLRDSDLLDLPDAPDFISKEPQMTMDEMIAHCEKMLPQWNKIRYSSPPKKFVGKPFELLD